MCVCPFALRGFLFSFRSHIPNARLCVLFTSRFAAQLFLFLFTLLLDIKRNCAAVGKYAEMCIVG